MHIKKKHSRLLLLDDYIKKDVIVARTIECVWEICVSNALMYGVGGSTP
jgi:hypothetical protein